MSQTKNIRVLLVDDDEHFRRFLRRDLVPRNYEIVGEAEDGKQAIELFKDKKPDLILLDFDMPTTNGSEVLEEMLALNPDALVIMVTGREDIATMSLCVEKGAFHFIRKDYPRETMFSVIDESLKKFADKLG